jgi:Nuclease-related domain
VILKSADDKARRVALLKNLQTSPLLDAFQRNWLATELKNTLRGIQGERDAAHYIDNAFRDSPNSVVIHDLRLSIDGEVAQIDHLLVHRTLRFYLFETKNFNGNVHINDHGEFSVSYGDEREFGIESPLEQSRRHERVLAKALDRLCITGRAGLKPTFHHAVLLHPKAIIHRPDSSCFDTSGVIKADQVGTWMGQYNVKEMSGFSLVGAVMNIHSLDTAKGWAEKIMGLHCAADLLALPEFMKPQGTRPIPTRTIAPPPLAVPTPPPAATDESLRRKLVCVTCGEKISFAEGKFCWNQEGRFGGFQYCRAHQAQVGQTASKG